ncbi:hypothetical protein GCM10023350_14800 [Nocardioides endophyticus]|uniref:Bacterial Ig-like domain-containing protein n=1 Tax=Nocardioides endophyticus TaxID=1353775 RepID=A0ABP8YMK6_9ACTN
MNLRHLTARTAAVGVTTALAAGALVGLSSSAADAASVTVTNNYTCTIAAASMSFDLPVEVTGDIPLTDFWAGAPVQKDLLSLTSVKATVPAAIAGALGTYGVSSARSDDFALSMGANPLPVPLPLTTFTDGAGGTKIWNVLGAKNAAFTTPDPGLTAVSMPSKLTFTAVSATLGDVAIPCVLKTGETVQKITDINLNKQVSTLSAKAPKKVKKGKAASVKVTAASTSWGATVPTGKVVAKEGKKVVGKATLKKGKAVIKLSKKLKVGKHKIKVSYAGTKSLGGSTAKTVVVKVVK